MSRVCILQENTIKIKRLLIVLKEWQWICILSLAKFFAESCQGFGLHTQLETKL